MAGDGDRAARAYAYLIERYPDARADRTTRALCASALTERLAHAGHGHPQMLILGLRDRLGALANTALSEALCGAAQIVLDCPVGRRGPARDRLVRMLAEAPDRQDGMSS